MKHRTMKLLMIRLHHILKSSYCLMYLPEHCAPSMQAYLWFMVSLKVEWEAEPSAIRLLSCGNIFDLVRGADTLPTFKSGLKTFLSDKAYN